MIRPVVLVVALVATLAAGTAAAPGAPRAAPPAGQIVFVSPRATANPGEIWALAPGKPPRDVSRSPYADVALGVSPVGRAFAFWSNRSGPWRLLVAPDGGAFRARAIQGRAGADYAYPSLPPIFSPDGRRLLIPFASQTVQYHLEFALADVRSGSAKQVKLPCQEPPLWSPDGLLVACAGSAGRVAVADLAGHLRFRIPGSSPFWSHDGRLAVSDGKRTRVVSARGTPIDTLDGVARGWSPDGRLLALTRPGMLLLAQPGSGVAPRIFYRHGDGTIYSVAFTPDGREISFGGDTVEPELRPLAGGPGHRLAAGFYGQWSPDGRHYLFANAGATEITLRIGDRVGNGARVIGRLPFNDHELSSLAWLGDGSAALYDGSLHDHADLWAMRADGSGQHRLTHTGQRISEPAWSSDGTKLAYGTAKMKGGLCGYCGGDVAVADAGGRKRALVPGAEAGQESSDGGASWSPSGTQIAVTNVYDGGVWVTGLDGSARTEVAPPDATTSPAWSPDGTTVAYVSYADGRIWGVDPAGANRRVLLPGPSPKARSVAWSPAGGELAFSTGTGIYVAAADGSGAPRRVTKAQTPGRPSFSPDGSWLTFDGQTGTVHPYRAIYVVGVDGRGLRRLTRGPFDSSDPAWRPATP
jgi:Tol biopolymer transport system component